MNKNLLFESQKKSLLIAGLINFFIPGSAKVYCGDILWGICSFLLYCLFILPLAFLTGGAIFFIVNPILVIGGMLYAQRSNRRLARQILGY